MVLRSMPEVDTSTAKAEKKSKEKTVDEKKPEAAESKAVAPTEAKGAAKAEAPSTIVFDDFVKVDLRVGLILEAEAVPKSDKLVRCQIDLGEEKPRQILAGIRLHYAPEALVGKRVIVVANLAPRKMMGLESHGMILAASDTEHGLSVLRLEKDIAPGTRVS